MGGIAEMLLHISNPPEEPWQAQDWDATLQKGAYDGATPAGGPARAAKPQWGHRYGNLGIFKNDLGVAAALTWFQRKAGQREEKKTSHTHANALTHTNSFMLVLIRPCFTHTEVAFDRGRKAFNFKSAIG